MEWNAESNGVLRRMRIRYHTAISLKFLVCGAESLGYCQGGGDCMEHSFAQGTSQQLVFIAISLHLVIQQSSVGV